MAEGCLSGSGVLLPHLGWVLLWSVGDGSPGEPDWSRTGLQVGHPPADKDDESTHQSTGQIAHAFWDRVILHIEHQ